jgi:hypothetical protein
MQASCAERQNAVYLPCICPLAETHEKEKFLCFYEESYEDEKTAFGTAAGGGDGA